jgi:hypothetical protein
MSGGRGSYVRGVNVRGVNDRGVNIRAPRLPYCSLMKSALLVHCNSNTFNAASTNKWPRTTLETALPGSICTTELASMQHLGLT